MNSEQRMQIVQPTFLVSKNVTYSRRVRHERKISQVARNRSTRTDLCVHIRCPILICFTPSSGVDEAQSVGVIEKSVKDQLGVENSHLVKIFMFDLEFLHNSGKLGIVV